VRIDNIQPTVKVGESSLRVSWTAEQFSGTHFYVQYRKPGESWPAAGDANNVQTTEYKHTFNTGIDPSTTYQVRMHDLRGIPSPWTEPVTVTTLGTIPAGASPEAAGSSGQPDWNAHPGNPPVIYVYAPKQALTDWYGSTDWQLEDNLRYWVRAALLDSPEWAGNHIKASASGFFRSPQYPIYLSNSKLVTGTEYEIRWEFRIGNDRSNILRVTTRATAR